MQLIKHKDKIYQTVTHGPFAGYLEVPIPEYPAYMDYNGPRIPFEMWQAVLAWFAAHKEDEVQLRFYVNFKLKTWRFVVFPQAYPTSMTTKELPDHPDVALVRSELTEDWTHFGSAHHHCRMGASQSGTDRDDEMNCPGIHITIGKLDEDQYDIDARTSFVLPGRMSADGKSFTKARKAFYSANLTQWFHLPKDIKVPEALQERVLLWAMTQPVDNTVEYPTAWDERLIRPAPITPTYGGYGSHNNPRTEQPLLPSNAPRPPYCNGMTRKERKRKEREANADIEAENYKLAVDELAELLQKHKCSGTAALVALTNSTFRSALQIEICSELGVFGFNHGMDVVDVERMLIDEFVRPAHEANAVAEEVPSAS